jgi:LysR family transcriptional activator of nhaA
MQWLNYHHLLYFWTVVRTGGVTRASEELHLTPQTVGMQVKALERALGEKLLERSGRRLAPTEVGSLVASYAEEIFSLGQELRDVLKGGPRRRPLKLVVGIVDVLPKLVVHALLDPVFQMEEPTRIACEEGHMDSLVAELSVHRLDLILSDSPMPAHYRVRAYNHLLGECGVVLMAAKGLASRLRSGFPKSLNGVPFLLPSEDSAMRRDLDQWFERVGVRVNIVAEFVDSALQNVFGQEGAGVFAVPEVIEKEVRRQRQVERVGRAEGLSARFYAISVERRLTHPAVAVIARAAHADIFPQGGT